MKVALYSFVVLFACAIMWKSTTLTVRLCDDIHRIAADIGAMRQAIAPEPVHVEFRTGQSAKQPLETCTF